MGTILDIANDIEIKRACGSKPLQLWSKPGATGAKLCFTGYVDVHCFTPESGPPSFQRLHSPHVSAK